LDKALKEFLKAVNLEPNDPELYYELGKIYHQKSKVDKKNIGKAVFYYEKYLYLGGKEEAEVKESLKLLKKKDHKVL
jgi:TPR repeat protein